MTEKNYVSEKEYRSPATDAYLAGDGLALYKLSVETGKKVIKLITDELAAQDGDTYIAPDIIVGLMCLQQVTAYIQSELEADVEQAKEAGVEEFQSIVSAISEIPGLMEQGRAAAKAATEADNSSTPEAMAKGHTPQ